MIEDIRWVTKTRKVTKRHYIPPHQKVMGPGGRNQGKYTETVTDRVLQVKINGKWQPVRSESAEQEE